ncbi:hypothetical protein BATDEDRAFT_87643 [Batrachochytrium dendrobatidis JAM81]|uniref:Uncharacterized protein n=1 Tax=Batrachochytrium dendrobatidis (strain JAM81 / FGSC 10211) TaxID=684364 RepID=F4P0U5_BATDJ|nr:uncharacterized protein BATDEDRAFT_87643 [Batrachochytrium dendrobatidis JAM81]EGF81653.1 hypothetical protein BATDEDRAFT_87643 [Batrachochytrium dendrobatidis JAM81]|eukprot:XP_006678278.1 hypothetical protein BATDEDRAFT_87643 [Batrachochytrium dendrobatidis JAM81]
MSPFSSLLTIRSKSDLTHSSVSPTASISDTDSTTRITFADGSSTSLIEM